MKLRALRERRSIDLPVPREPSRKQGSISSKGPVFKASGAAKVLARRSGRSSKYSALILRNGLLATSLKASDTIEDAPYQGVLLSLTPQGDLGSVGLLGSSLP